MIHRALLLGAFLMLGCGGAPPRPAIHFVTDVEVTRVFLPEQVRVQLTGLPPGSLVTLRASMPGYASWASFRADAQGSVDAASQAPLDGTYDGADADGLFWSMVATGATPAPGAGVDVTVRAELSGEEVARATLARDEADPGLVETEVREDGLFAVLVTPPDPGPHPALLTFGGSEGGIDVGLGFARLHASLGYACLALAYFGAPGLPQKLEDVPLEYFGRALSWMKQRPEVDAGAIGVLGASRGGELALLLGAAYPEVKAVVAQVPSGVVWSSGDPPRRADRASSWTIGGKELPFVPGTDAPRVFTEDAEGRTVEHETPVYRAAVDAAPPGALDAATTRVERVRGPVLMLASAEDEMWPSCRLAGIAMDRLVASGHAAAFADDLECYPGAGHIVGRPGLPTTDPPIVPAPWHGWFALGGTPAGTAHAARDAFERRRAFLAAALGVTAGRGGG